MFNATHVIHWLALLKTKFQVLDVFVMISKNLSSATVIIGFDIFFLFK